MAARRLGRVVLDIALPPACMACRTAVSEPGCLCGPCWRRLELLASPRQAADGLRLAGERTPAGHRVRAAAAFGPVARDLVHGLKYADREELAPSMARMMARAGHDLLAEADALVPVPLHPLRLWRRRFNQSALLAKGLARESGVALKAGWLVRRRATTPQVGLERQARAENVEGAFVVPQAFAAELAGRNLVLVDDVLTTGATVNACAMALLEAGAMRVDVLVFARVVDGEVTPIS